MASNSVFGAIVVPRTLSDPIGYWDPAAPSLPSALDQLETLLIFVSENVELLFERLGFDDQGWARDEIRATLAEALGALQRTVIRRRGDAASAPFHYALAARFTRQRAAAELRRYAAARRRLAGGQPLLGRGLTRHRAES
jgi:hypothetical protein